jgi:3-oxoacyl-(acyl-carrier-protein) synthase
MKIFLSKYSTLSTEKTQAIEDAAFPQRVHWFPETYDKTKTGMVHVPQRLVDRVVTQEMIEYAKDVPDGSKVGFILAGGSQVWGTGGLPVYEVCYSNSMAHAYKVEILNVTNIFGARLAAKLNANDYVATDASTCASSLKVMMDVRHLIEMYGFDRVIVLSLEDSVCNTVMNFFGAAKANLCLDDEARGAIPSAFDSTNGGFYLGQGVVLAVFDSEKILRSKPYAELLGAYTAGEPNANPLGQREDGMGYRRAIDGALRCAGKNADDVRLIKTHGTGTQVNNKAERAAIESIFTDFIATSYKQRIGHTVGASGLLETCLLLDDVRRGTIPEIKNRTEEDKKFISSPAKAPGGLLLSLSAGMGNVYAAALFDYYEHNKI